MAGFRVGCLELYPDILGGHPGWAFWRPGGVDDIPLGYAVARADSGLWAIATGGGEITDVALSWTDVLAWFEDQARVVVAA